MTTARDLDTRRTPRRLLLGSAAAATLLAFGLDLGPGYAASVFEVSPGPFATLVDFVLGAPTGGGPNLGSFDTYSLGVNGFVTVEMDAPLVDGAGTDLIVCENPFFVTGTLLSYVEAAFVEVSTDGVDYARFPSRYSGPSGPIPDFTGVNPAFYEGLAGVMPVSASPPDVDPLDVVAGGGDAFDLSALAGDPLVQSGDVDLWNIRYVRVLDVWSGQASDSQGHLIWDCGNLTSSSADIDAIVGVNTLDNIYGGRPEVELELVAGVMVLRLSDIDGLSDIKHGLTMSVNGLTVPFALLLPYVMVTDAGPTHVELSTLGFIPPGVFQAVVKVAARDPGGLIGGDAVFIP